ncbi:MAG: exonuclease SbcCD subunit D [Spirochaetaceae bacterium]|nr:exonuclease SbcCD subunit D [Spirochaetaceae bacterium]
MKFLQTGDLHLGKFFYEYPLLEDQKHVLKLLIDELKAEQNAGAPYDALVIAGDVYDRSLPPADAVQVFSDFLAEVQKSFSELHVLIIPGNHDSAIRLSYAQKILEKQRIHIRTDLSRIDEPVIIKDAAFYLMPFLLPASLAITENAEKQPEPSPIKAEKLLLAENSAKEQQNLTFDFDTADSAQSDAAAQSDEARAAAAQAQTAAAQTSAAAAQSEKKETYLMSQAALAEEALKRINLAKNKDIANILVAHLFAAGSVESDSERVIWGTAEQVDASLFKDFAYTALGHLHRYQKAAAHAFYSGSPLAYSFGESSGTGADKVFLRVEIEKGAEPSVTAIPIKPLHRVVSLKGSFDEFLNSKTYDEYKDCFIEIESTEDTIVENPVMLLRKKFPLLLSFKQDNAFEKISSAEMAGRRSDISSENLSINSQFELFLKEIHGNFDGDETEKTLFDELFAKMKEENHETE